MLHFRVRQLQGVWSDARASKVDTSTNSQTIRLLCWAVITLPVIAIGASTAGLSQPKSFDGAYKGSLECEQSGFEAFRMQLAISIREGRVTGGASILDIDGRQVGPELGFGTVNPDGTFNQGAAQPRPATVMKVLG